MEERNLERIKEAELEAEANLEERLVRTDGAQIGDVEVLYVGRQGSPGKGGIFDILGIDARGDTVIVELKRDRAPRDIVAQALEYAAEVRNVEYQYLDDQYRQFVREEQEGTGEIPSLREAHAEYFDLDEPLNEREFNTNQRLVVVGTEFADVSLHMADFLREHGIDVVAVEYSTYRTTENGVELLVTDGVRRPLSEEPTPSTTGQSRPDYSHILSQVRDRTYDEIGELLGFSERENLNYGEKELRFTSQDPEHPDCAYYRFRPEIEQEQAGSIVLMLWGGSDDEKEQVESLVQQHGDELDDFDIVEDDSYILVKKDVAIEQDYTNEEIDEVATSLVELIEFYHPTLVENVGTPE